MGKFYKFYQHCYEIYKNKLNSHNEFRLI
jgi:hypothetical protein